MDRMKEPCEVVGTIEINFWDAKTKKVELREVPVVLVEEHDGELIAAVDADVLYGWEPDDMPMYVPYSVKVGVRANLSSSLETPEAAIDAFVKAWRKSAKPLTPGICKVSDGFDPPLIVRGTIKEPTP